MVAGSSADPSPAPGRDDLSPAGFLDLLARDASPVEFERIVLDARARGAGPDRIAELEAAKMVALQVSAELRAHRRRQSELTALFETASDLAALSSVDDILQAIVRRARSLLGRDVTYLTLNDEERGDTYMRVTDGSTSAKFQQLRLPLGAGLGGLVAQTARPYATTDYMADQRFEHTEAIDGGVVDEGLVSIMGTPLLLGSRVIGVLFASDRRSRPTDPEDIALLSSLAAHAAVAIDNARLLTEARTAVHELQAANERLQETAERTLRAADAHDRLTQLVLGGEGVEEVVRELGVVLGGPVFVVDPDLRPLGGAGGELPGEVGEGLRDHATQALAAGRVVRKGPVHLAPVMASAECLGFVGFVGEEQPEDGNSQIRERGAQVTALLLLFRRTVAEAESRGHRELLEDLLADGALDRERIDARARVLGVDLYREHAVVVAQPEDPIRVNTQAETFLATSLGGLASRVKRRLVFLVPTTSPGQAARTISADLGRTLGTAVTAAGASAGSGPEAIARAHADAHEYLDALITLGRIGVGASEEELGFLGVLLGSNRDVAGFVARTLQPLMAYDARRGTDLVATLEAYFAQGGNLKSTATALTVHTNTVSQRLSRITQLLGSGWQQPERSLEIQVALRLRGLQARPLDLDRFRPEE